VPVVYKLVVEPEEIDSKLLGDVIKATRIRRGEDKDLGLIISGDGNTRT